MAGASSLASAAAAVAAAAFVTAPSSAQVITPDITVAVPPVGPQAQIWVDVNPTVAGIQRCTVDTMGGDVIVNTTGGPIPCDFTIDVRLQVTSTPPGPLSRMREITFTLWFDPAVAFPVGVAAPAFFGLDPAPVMIGAGLGAVTISTGAPPCGGINIVAGASGVIARVGFVAPIDGQTGIDVSGSAPIFSSVAPPCGAPAPISFNDVNARGQVIINHVGPAVGCWTVNRAVDAPDFMPGDGISDANPALGIIDSTLSACITEANLRAGPDGLAFDIGPGGPQPPIIVGSTLPVISDLTGGLFIDGQSATNVVISGAGAASGLVVTAPGNTIRNVAIAKFPSYGIDLSGPNSANNVITGCRIGIDWGDGAASNGTGVRIANGAHDNRVGGSLATDRNIISDNSVHGVLVDGAGVPANAANNIIRGNFIGLASDGSTAAGNAGNGVLVSAATGTMIGGRGAGDRNSISGNLTNGVEFQGACTGSQVLGNYVGPDTSGSAGPGNTLEGIYILDASGITVGGSAAGANVISSNQDGVVITGGDASGNTIEDNLVGLRAGGMSALGNLRYGVVIASGAHDNHVGAPDHGNVISGNVDNGVYLIADGGDNSIQSNIIGLNATGSAALGNANGVVLDTSNNNDIGATGVPFTIITGGAAEGNVISGNNGDGVLLSRLCRFNVIAYNLIGINAVYTELGNALDGVDIYGASASNWLAHNTIGANGAAGVEVLGGGTDANQLFSNLIGSSDYPNLAHGVWVHCGPERTGLQTNFIRANAGDGVHVQCPATAGTVVYDNTIEINSGRGVAIELGAGPSMVVSNVITGNGSDGISLLASDTALIESNDLHLNAGAGVYVAAGGIDITQNTIYANGGLGIDLLNENSTVIIQSHTMGGGTITLGGTFGGAPSSAHTLEFFNNDVCDPSGFGEGRTYLGSGSATTGPTGTGTFLISVPQPAPLVLPLFITATATGPSQSTSEFSNCYAITGAPPPPPCPWDLNHDGVVDGADLGLLLAGWGGSGAADIDASGSVDGADLGLVLAHWGRCPA